MLFFFAVLAFLELAAWFCLFPLLFSLVGRFRLPPFADRAVVDIIVSKQSDFQSFVQKSLSFDRANSDFQRLYVEGNCFASRVLFAIVCDSDDLKKIIM